MAEWLEYLESLDLAVGSGSCALASVASVASRALARARCLGLVLAVPISHWRGKSPRPKGGAPHDEVGRANRHEGRLNSKVGQAATRPDSIHLAVVARQDLDKFLPFISAIRSASGPSCSPHMRW